MAQVYNIKKHKYNTFVCFPYNLSQSNLLPTLCLTDTSIISTLSDDYVERKKKTFTSPLETTYGGDIKGRRINTVGTNIHTKQHTVHNKAGLITASLGSTLGI